MTLLRCLRTYRDPDRGVLWYAGEVRWFETWQVDLLVLAGYARLERP